MSIASKVVFISDPGHGWLKVLLPELDTLGIREQISPYSFYDTRFAYLEEDADASVYLEARRSQGYDETEFDERYTNYFSRDKARFNGQLISEGG